MAVLTNLHQTARWVQKRNRVAVPGRTSDQTADRAFSRSAQRVGPSIHGALRGIHQYAESRSWWRAQRDSALYRHSRSAHGWSLGRCSVPARKCRPSAGRRSGTRRQEAAGDALSVAGLKFGLMNQL